MAKSSSSRKSSSTKIAAAADTSSGVVVAGADTVDPGDAVLNALLADIESAGTPVVAETVIESDTPLMEGAEVAGHTDAELSAAVGSAESLEISIATATPEGIEGGAAVPTAKGAKKATTPKKFYSDKTERLKDRVGTGLADFTVLTVADAPENDEALKHRMEETLAIIKGMNSKKQNRAGFLIEFLAGKKAKLNEVLERTLTVLSKDGFISTGKDGNVMTNLIAKPYSVAAARAMSGNTISMFEDLKLIKADGKGRYLPNAESTLLSAVNARLFTPAAAAV